MPRSTKIEQMTTPLISIVMAARNTGVYIAKCLLSIQAQTYQNWELIAVDDRSTDDTRDILERFAREDTRIRVFSSDGERLNPALYFGQRQMRGTLINRMDSDDYMPPDKLQSMYDLWVTHGKGHIVAGGTQHFVEDGEVGRGFRRYEDWLNERTRKADHYKHIYKECVIPSHCWLIHRDDFLQVGGFEPDVYPEDYDLCFRYYGAGYRIVALDKIVHYWLDRSDRISRTWEEYKDNRYYDLKLGYFYELDRDSSRPLVVWGAGPNGKDLVKRLLQKEQDLIWVCDTPRKIGNDIYGIKLRASESVSELDHPQIMVAVASPEDQATIQAQLTRWNLSLAEDYWFFL